MGTQRDDHPTIRELERGDQFDSYFVLRALHMQTTRANKPFLVLELADRTGRIMAKLWDDAEVAYRSLTTGEVVKVRASVEDYQGRAELKIIRIRQIPREDVGDFSRFLPTSQRDPEEDWAIIREAVERVEHTGLSALLQTLLEDEAFVEGYQRSAAGKRWHHAYLGGLLEHSARLVELVEDMAARYPQLDRDLLVAGAVLHDVGKLEELTRETAIDYTTEGRLLGHIVLGAHFLRRAAEEVEELDHTTLVQLEHLILSHQGSRENGCPVEPMTREAFVLYYMDEVDSKLNAIERELEKASGGGGEFTEHIRLLNRMLYKGPSAAELERAAEKAAASPEGGGSGGEEEPGGEDGSETLPLL